MTMNPADGPGDGIVVGDVTSASALLEDDRFLDGLAVTGDAVPPDPLGALLAEYHADLSAETDTFEPAKPLHVGAGPVTAGTVASNLVPDATPAAPSVHSAAQRANRRWTRRGTAGGLGVIIALSGVGAAAAASHPGQLLYPLRRSIAGPRQDMASREIARILKGQLASSGASSASLRQAQALLAQVGDPGLRAQLQRQLEAAQTPPSVTPTGGSVTPLPLPTQDSPLPPPPGPGLPPTPVATSPTPAAQPPSPTSTPQPPPTVIRTAPPGQAKKSASPSPSGTPATATTVSPTASPAPPRTASASASATNSPVPTALTSPSTAAAASPRQGAKSP